MADEWKDNMAACARSWRLLALHRSHTHSFLAFHSLCVHSEQEL